MDIEKLNMNHYSYCFSLVELNADGDYDQVYVAGFAEENMIRSSEWFKEYTKNTDSLTIEISWYCTEGLFDNENPSIDPDSLKRKNPTSMEMKCLMENMGEFIFSIIGSCAFSIDNEIER